MKNVIIYGLGRKWERNKEEIVKEYKVIGHSDSNDSFQTEYSDFITKEQLVDVEDGILVCAAWPTSADIIHELVEEMNIEPKRIMLWDDEKNKKNRSQSFYSYAQFGEDYVINSLLRKRGIALKDATYVELGVCNPINDNNTYFLHLGGARGLLVDANKEYIAVIKTLREQSIVLNKAVVEDSSETPVIRFYITEDGGTSSVDVDSIRFHNTDIKDSIEVSTITINECMEQLGEKCIVLSVDLEGLDENVLFSLDFDKYAPVIICAETRNKGGRIFSYLEEKGYSYVFSNGVNDIWMKEGQEKK